MTDSTRPPGFKAASPKAGALSLFFGKGDYVIARTAAEASCLWMDYFDDLCYAKDFSPIDDDELIELWVSEQSGQLAELSSVLLDEAYVLAKTAADLVRQHGAGYLASTEEN